MAGYKIEKTVKSCDVSIELIEQLENYIKQKATELGRDDEYFQTSFKVVLVDRFGREEISSINSYKSQTFSNDINGIVITCRNSSPYNLDIRVSFRKDRYSSEIKIEIFEQENAKEVANSIYSSINEIIKDHQNIHFLMYGQFLDVIIPLISGISLGLLIVLIIMKDSISIYFLYFILIFNITFLSFLLIRHFSPYCTIINRGNINKRKYLGNSIKWIFGFLLAGYIGKLIF